MREGSLADIYYELHSQVGANNINEFNIKMYINYFIYYLW